jgi:hypothetical protein
MTRAETARRAALLREQGLSGLQIARELGISRSYAYELLDDPDGLKVKARKERYAQPCVDCRAPTSGSEGRREDARCQSCAAAKSGREKRLWTRELIIARIREWAALHGEPPAVPDWNPPAARLAHDEARAQRFEAAGGHWPWTSDVIERFGTWNTAISAARYEPRAPHGGSGNQLRARKRTAPS